MAATRLDSDLSTAGASSSGLKPACEIDPARVLAAAEAVSAELGRKARFHYGAPLGRLEVSVPAGSSDAVAATTIDFYVRLEERLGAEAMEELSVDFSVEG